MGDCLEYIQKNNHTEAEALLCGSLGIDWEQREEEKDISLSQEKFEELNDQIYDLTRRNLKYSHHQ